MKTTQNGKRRPAQGTHWQDIGQETTARAGRTQDEIYLTAGTCTGVATNKSKNGNPAKRDFRIFASFNPAVPR